METLRKLGTPVYGLAFALITVWSFLVPDAKGFPNPAFARIFFWHFPCPIHAFILMALGGWFSYKVLTTPEDARWDVRSEAAHELAMVFMLLTLASGILFSKLQWGAWWQRDPRQESYLLVTLIYAAYFVLRTAFTDRHKKAVFSAGYALFAFLPAQFLTFIFPRLPQIKNQSFHPTTSIMEGQIKGQYAYVIIGVIALVAILTYRVYRVRVQAGLLEYEAENQDGKLEISSRNTARTSVVRPVPVPPEV